MELVKPNNDLQLLTTKDGSYTLYDTQNDETYHSKFGAKAESDTVFLLNTGVSKRLEQLLPTKVLEIGFGTGFNFVNTAHKAIACKSPLHYTGIEMRPPPPALANELLKHNAPKLEALCDFTSNSLARCQLNSEAGDTHFDPFTTLNLICADALEWPLPRATYDAIYLDAFSIKNNPTLWSASFLQKLCNAIKVDGVLATYCVSRTFRDALTDAGFNWQKHPGPMGKREVLTASRSNLLKPAYQPETT